MYPEVIRIVLHRTIDDLEIRDAVLEGYRRVAVPARSYPTGIAALGSKIHGKLVSGLTEEDLRRLDAYEASFYVRTTVSVQTDRGMAKAFAYIDGRDPLPFPIREWDAETYEKEHLATFINTLKKQCLGARRQ